MEVSNEKCEAGEGRMVNGGLQQAGIGISPASHQSVMNNLQQVHAGTMSQGTAHFAEAASFAQDAVNSFAHGRRERT